MGKRFGLVVVIAMVMTTASTLPAQSAGSRVPGDARVKEKLVGAWRLAWVEEQGVDGKTARIVDRRGTLVYTRDGHISVQIMLPKPEESPSRGPIQYDQGGYEAYYGTYDVNEPAHTVTHHVEGALVRALIGKDLSREYRFSEGLLILKSSRPDEHWTIAWVHY